ncbi:MAG: HD domain-containing protein [Nanoarchaeota archaeon]
MTIVPFIYELGQLKRVKRSGWWIAHVKDPESVAEHSFRTALLGYLLAKEEGADAQKTAMMCLLQDVPEARLNDLHKVGHRYIDFKAAEAKAFAEQVSSLPAASSAELKALFSDFHDERSREGTVARDADLLECAFTAKEYLEQGHKDCQDWIDNVRGLLKTSTAKRLLAEMEKTPSRAWWHGLKSIGR